MLDSVHKATNGRANIPESLSFISLTVSERECPQTRVVACLLEGSGTPGAIWRTEEPAIFLLNMHIWVGELGG